MGDAAQGKTTGAIKGQGGDNGGRSQERVGARRSQGGIPSWNPQPESQDIREEGAMVDLADGIMGKTD